MAELDSAVRTVIEIPADFSARRIPAGDLQIGNPLAWRYDNVIVYPGQFIVLKPAVDGPSR
jgi:hypothetical protein